MVKPILNERIVEDRICQLMGRNLGLYFLARKEISDFLHEKGFKNIEIFSYISRGVDITGRMLSIPKIQSFEFMRIKYERLLWEWYHKNTEHYSRFMEENEEWFA